jgi:MFS family permease
MIAFFVAAGAPTPLWPIYEASWHFAPWLLTLAFGVYAIALLLTLLVIGSLSDHLGRRPLLIAALALELVAMIVFAFAPSIDWLIVARVIQGVATGAASSAFSAAVVELAPEHRKKLGGLMVSLAPLAGLGLGAIFAGIVAFFIPSAAALTVWFVLIVVMTLGTVFAIFTPETATPKPGALASLKPTVSVPNQVRRLFAVTLPGTVSAFMTMALFLGLIPTVLAAVFSVSSPLVAGLAALVAFGVGAAVSAATGKLHPHQLRLLGSAFVTVGTILFVAGIGADLLPLLWATAVFGGAGLGASFSGTVRGLVPEVKIHERAGLFAAIYLVVYLAMGVSAIVAGIVATFVGVIAMAIGFGIITGIISVASLAISVGALRPRQRPAAER